MKTIPLTNSDRLVLVDDEDFELLAENNWQINSETGAVQRCERVAGRTVTLLIARVIMNAPRGFKVDHWDHDTLNNQKSNLRICTRSQNGMNRRKQTAPTSSRFKGVTRTGAKWAAQIRTSPTATSQKRLGLFDTEEAAALAYNDEATKAFGEFALLNEVNV